MALVVLAIWGKVIYDLLAVSNGGQLPIMSSKSLENNESLIDEKFEYEVSGDYRDPFLGNYAVKEKKSSGKKIEAKVEKTKPMLNISWPKIKYMGLIKNKSKDHDIAIVNMNGKEMLLKSGEQVGNIVLQNANADSLVFVQGEEFKTVYK